MESSGIYNQNQLISNVRSQVNSRISLNGFYMYGHANSNTDGVNTLPANPYSGVGSMARRRWMCTIGRSSADPSPPSGISGLSPFIVINSGAPFNITTGSDPFDTTLFTARPGLVVNPSLLPPGTTTVSTAYGILDPNPYEANFQVKPGEVILPRDFGRSPGQLTVNLRLSKTFGFGPSREGFAGPGPGGGPGGGGGHTPGAHGGPPGGGMMNMGGMFGGGGTNTGKRYNLTFSVNARNLLNHLNPGPVNGIVTSPLFGESQLAGWRLRAFSQNANNRRLEFQVRFAF